MDFVLPHLNKIFLFGVKIQLLPTKHFGCGFESHSFHIKVNVKALLMFSNFSQIFWTIFLLTLHQVKCK
jgi:hypothetical protein